MKNSEILWGLPKYDTKWAANAFGKMVLIDLLDARLPQTFSLWKETQYVWSIVKCNKIKYTCNWGPGSETFPLSLMVSGAWGPIWVGWVQWGLDNLGGGHGSSPSAQDTGCGFFESWKSDAEGNGVAVIAVLMFCLGSNVALLIDRTKHRENHPYQALQMQ